MKRHVLIVGAGASVASIVAALAPHSIEAVTTLDRRGVVSGHPGYASGYPRRQKAQWKSETSKRYRR